MALEVIDVDHFANHVVVKLNGKKYNRRIQHDPSGAFVMINGKAYDLPKIII